MLCIQWSPSYVCTRYAFTEPMHKRGACINGGCKINDDQIVLYLHFYVILMYTDRQTDILLTEKKVIPDLFVIEMQEYICIENIFMVY